MVRIIGAALLLAACVDKVSEDGHGCPCGDGRACCFDVCMPEGDACVVEDTFGLGGGTLTAPNGAMLEIPFGALSEDTVLRMRSVEPEPVDGITFLGGAIALEPDGLELGEAADLTLPFDIERVPAGANPDDVRLYRTPAAFPGYQRNDTETTATTMQSRVGRLMLYVPAHGPECTGISGSGNSDGCRIETLIDDTTYSVECLVPAGDPEMTVVDCRCLEDGVETRTVEGTCEYVLGVFQYGCGFSCDGEEPPVMPDAGPTDAAPI